MRSIYFATTNEGKLREAKDILGIDIKGVSLDIPEIQSKDIREIAIRKAQDYYSQIKKPLFVEDGGLFIESLGGLPGAYTSDFFDILGNIRVLELLSKTKKRDAYAEVVVAYVDGKITKTFGGKIVGDISKKELGSYGFGWDPIFIPKGSMKTFAEMDESEKNKLSMRKIALKKLSKWLKTSRA